MTNTYENNAPIDEKAKEELRLIRCLLERLLRSLNETNFVDYQMEKFGDKFKGDTFQNKEASPKTENNSQNDESQREISRPKDKKGCGKEMNKPYMDGGLMFCGEFGNFCPECKKESTNAPKENQNE